ncbi:DUF192 domain-containing protein [Acidicapsa dinghuensis]|uniref:DUF192 domain-containing protein n=2 Tax=Acidicapsa dinghuensis TaxID=2218256 RepID=A0ABW1EHL5_9BACT
MKAKYFRVLNRTRGTILAEHAQLAGTSSERIRGLLDRESLSQGEGLWIVPCESVHTFGMRFAIDLVYLDRKSRIRKIRHGVKPWRISACLIAHSILELPAGAVTKSDSCVGDQLELSQLADARL